MLAFVIRLLSGSQLDADRAACNYYRSYEGFHELPCFDDIKAYAVELTTLQELRELCEEESYEIAPYLVEKWVKKGWLKT